MNTKKYLSSVLSLVAALITIQANAKDKWQFKSKYDAFSLDQVGAAFYLNGKLIDGRWASDLKPVLDQSLTSQCPTPPGQADLTLNLTSGTTQIQRQFFLDKKIATDGEKCVDLSGLGIYYAPYHNFWFTGSEQLFIDLNSGFTLGADDKTWIELVPSELGLKSKTDGFYVNWKTVEDFNRFISQFKIEGRAHPAILKDLNRDYKSTSLHLIVKDKTYKIHRIEKGLWLMELPNVPWLILSSSFGFFEGMTSETWVSPYVEKLKAIRNRSSTSADRIGLISSLKGEASTDIRKVLKDILFIPDEDIEVKSAIVSSLRNSPSDEVMLILARSLQRTDDTELLTQIIATLKLRNPKGQQIKKDADPKTHKKIIESWLLWAKQFEKTYK